MALRTALNVNKTKLKETTKLAASRRFSSTKTLVGVNVDDKTGYATVTLQRPPVNGLNLALLTELNTALATLEKDKSRGVLLTSSSPTAFSAGMDIFEIYKPDAERLSDLWTRLQDVWIHLYGSSFPTVAVINGHAPAGGCLLSLACEYRVMAKNLTIGLNETLLGLVAPKWFIASMENVIGTRRTETALTTGQTFRTEEALRVGLIDEVCDSKEEGLAKGAAFLDKFKNISPLARSMTKKSVRKGTIDDMVANRANDLKAVADMLNDESAQKLLGTYLETLKKKSAK